MSAENINNSATPAAQLPPAASALDTIAQDPAPGTQAGTLPAGLQKFMNQAETYMHKAVETAKPYTNAVAHKTEEIMHQIQGQVSATTAQTSAAADNLEHSAAETTEKAVREGEEDVASAKGFFGQGLGRVSATFSQVTTAIDARTATPSHPGIATMLSKATQNMIEKVDHMMDASAEHPASTSAAAAAVAPFQAPSRSSSISAPTAVPSASASASASAQPQAHAHAHASSSAAQEPVTAGPNTATSSSAPVRDGERPVTTTTNSVGHSDVV